MSITTKNSVPVQQSIEDGTRKHRHVMDCWSHSLSSFSDCDKVNEEGKEGIQSQ